MKKIEFTNTVNDKFQIEIPKEFHSMFVIGKKYRIIIEFEEEKTKLK